MDLPASREPSLPTPLWSLKWYDLMLVPWIDFVTLAKFPLPFDLPRSPECQPPLVYSVISS
eukprot:1161932-Pelagomonas_calceolata.AAC.1